MRRALFIDRDGIFNEVVFRNGKMHSPGTVAEIKHYPGLEKLSEIKKAGYLLLMVTNQPDVERGIVSEAFLKELHGDYQTKYALDGIYCCPHASDTHPDKKPNPGMFLRAEKEWDLDLSRSFHLGDTDRDVEAAKRAGICSLLWDRPYNQGLACDHRVHSLEDVIQITKIS